MREAIRLQDLKKINDWIQLRLSLDTDLRDPQHKDIDTKQLLREFVQGKIVAMKTAMDCRKCCIVTVRSEFRKTQEYLRPDYSFPGELAGLLDQPEFQRPFAFKFDPVGQEPFSTDLLVHPSTEESLPDRFVALHKVAKFEPEDPHSERSDTQKYFEARINAFWDQLQDCGEEAVRASYIQPENVAQEYDGAQLYCLFAAQNAEANPTRLVPKHIAAIYFVAEPSAYDAFSSKRLNEELLEIASQLFEGIALIEKIDSALFQLEGLQVVADLLPQFSNEELAPADKIAIGLDTLSDLLSKHIVGRTVEGNPPQIFYMSCAFEKTGEDSFLPRLSLYPLVHRRDYRLAATQIAHQEIASASKLLLLKYLTASCHRVRFGRNGEHEVVVDSRFADVLGTEELGIRPFEDWLNIAWQDDPDQVDLIHMVQHDTRLTFPDDEVSPWEAYNKPANPKRENKSIVAVVVESEPRGSLDGIPIRGLPRGVIAIESQHVAAFSDADVKGLKAVLSGFASLIRTVTHQNSPIDYTPQLRNAFQQFIPADRTLTDLDHGIMLSLVFLAHTLDAEEAKALCKELRDIEKDHPAEFEDYVKEGYKLDLLSLSIVENIVGLLKPRADNSLTERDANEHIEERVRAIQDYIRELPNDDGLESAVRFLEACSENFLWANYKYSFGQALGDRIHREIPDFYFMRPGYSASQMFMAVVENELKQVVKLSSKAKLDRERDRYLKFVRYRVVNAARIPVTAYAFDGDGQRGRDIKHLGKEVVATRSYREPYGVLVSDLVFAKDPDNTTVSTLISSVVDHFCGRSLKNPRRSDPTLPEIKSKLVGLFKDSLGLWRIPTDELPSKTLHEAARLSFRLPKVFTFDEPDPSDLAEEDPEIRRAAERQLHLYETYEQFKVFCSNSGHLSDSLKSKWGAEKLAARPRQDKLLSSLTQISHGDLNARNLAWADGLKSFFLIDFEHVGNSLAGTDQCRLAVNLLTDLFGSYLDTLDADGPHAGDQNETAILKITSEIDSVLSKFPILTGALARGGTTRLEDVIEGNTLLKHTLDSGEELWWLISSILSTLPIKRRSDDKEYAQTSNLLWSYCFFCSCLKEYEYSLRNISEQDLDAVMLSARSKRLNLYDLSAFELYRFLWIDDGLGKHRSKEMLAKLMRYFVSGKLLYKVVNES